MKRFFALAALFFSATSAFAQQTRTVNCSEGHSLNLTLATINKVVPATVTIQGTCTEYVLIEGFNNLTLTGAPGATIQQPSTNPSPNPIYVLSIKASRLREMLPLLDSPSTPCLPFLQALELAGAVIKFGSKT
jgi:hypothetical protein